MLSFSPRTSDPLLPAHQHSHIFFDNLTAAKKPPEDFYLIGDLVAELRVKEVGGVRHSRVLE